MKKNYIAPELEIDDMLVESMIAVSAGFDPGSTGNEDPEVPGQAEEGRIDW